MMQFPYPHVFTQSSTRQLPFMVGLKPPFPWFGGKRRVAHLVWERFGDIYNYVEPFFGSGAVLFNRPHEPRIETVNDKDKYLANFWRATQHDPAGVAKYADWPVNEADLHARHKWLVAQTEFNERMSSDPDYYDVKIAGWWVWGLSQWIGGGWCGDKSESVRIPNMRRNVGVHRKRPSLQNAGKGIHRPSNNLPEYFKAIRKRLRYVRIVCGDWSRVLTPVPTYALGLTAIFLDPPYSAGTDRDTNLYAVEDGEIAHLVRKWALENGDNPKMRIALCGYEGEHDMPTDWECIKWKNHGGYSVSNGKSGNENRDRERIWFSPHCLKVEKDKQLRLNIV
jgi:DNA adenine methylase